MQKFLMALTVAALSSMSSQVQASMIFGSQVFGVTVTKPAGSVASLLTFSEFEITLKTLANSGDPGDGFISTAGTTMGSAVLSAPVLKDPLSDLDPPVPSSFTFEDVGYGKFVASLYQTSYTMNSRVFSFSGTFTSYLGYDPTPVTLTFSLIQDNIPGPITGSGVMTSRATVDTGNPTAPGLVNPEPASIAMFGTMLVPLALGAFRRRQKAAQAAL